MVIHTPRGSENTAFLNAQSGGLRHHVLARGARKDFFSLPVNDQLYTGWHPTFQASPDPLISRGL